MPKSERTTRTSSSDTIEHPGHLTISGAPGRKSTYLYIERGNSYRAVARFMNAEAVEAFKNWAKAATGTTIQWSEDVEEGNIEPEA